MAKSKSITDHIRSRILERASLPLNDETPKCSLSPTQILDKEMDWEFLAEMAHGMIMGYFSFGPAQESKINNLEEAKRRIRRFEETRNLECLRDAANFLMRERRLTKLDNVHFTPTDDGTHSR